MSTRFIQHWRYWLDVRSVIVLLLFLVHSYVVYQCAMKGYIDSEGKLHQDGAYETDTGDQIPLIGSMYSIRVHFLRRWQTKGDILVGDVMTSAVAAADALILVSDNENRAWNQTEIVSYFRQRQRWPLVEPLSSFHDYNARVLYSFPERRLPSAADVYVPPLVMVRLHNILSFLGLETFAKNPFPASSPSPIAVCFVVEKNPADILLSLGRTLEDEFLLEPRESRIPAMTAHLSRIYNVSWAFFISPCYKSQVHVWDKIHFLPLVNFSVRWVCVASDTLIEVDTASRLLSVLSDE